MTSTPGFAARYSTRRLRCSARRATPWQRRRPAIYQSVLAAIATGNTTNGGIVAYIGRRSDELSHPLTVLEDAALIVREPDLFRSGLAAYGIAEPLITFYEAIMRRRWPELELGLAEPAWRAAPHTFNAQVGGPHFEAVCRSFATLSGADLFGELSAEVGHCTVNDPAERAQIQVDVAVFAAPGCALSRRAGPAGGSEPRPSACNPAM
jgi:uncharacterized protein